MMNGTELEPALMKQECRRRRHRQAAGTYTGAACMSNVMSHNVPSVAAALLLCEHTAAKQLPHGMSSSSLSARSSDVYHEDLRMKSPITGFFETLAPPRGDESMLEVCAKLIGDAQAGLNGINPDELISTCKLCDERGRDMMRSCCNQRR